MGNSLVEINKETNHLKIKAAASSVFYTHLPYISRSGVPEASSAHVQDQGSVWNHAFHSCPQPFVSLVPQMLGTDDLDN